MFNSCFGRSLPMYFFYEFCMLTSYGILEDNNTFGLFNEPWVIGLFVVLFTYESLMNRRVEK